MKQALMEAADTTVVLADSSKFEYSTLMVVADLSRVSTLVTDEQISDANRAEVEQAGVKLVVLSSSLRVREAESNAASGATGRTERNTSVTEGDD
jgi:hypothetical protein